MTDHDRMSDQNYYEKELLKAIIENESNQMRFQNTKNSVGISNSYRASSKMCNLI